MPGGLPIMTLPRKIFMEVSVGSALRDLASLYNLKRILLVADKTSRIAAEGLAGELRRGALDVKLTVLKAPCRAAGARMDDIDQLAESLGGGVDAIVVVGSSCTVCASKLALVRYHRPTMRLEDITPIMNLGIEGVRPLLIAAPTSGERGRSFDGIAAIDRGTRIDVVVNQELAPFAVIVDPALSAPLPSRSEAIDTLLDSMVHSYEALLSRIATPLSEAAALRALRQLYRLAPRLVEEEVSEVWGDLVRALTLSGIASSLSSVALTCATAFAIQERFGVPHGIAAGIALPHVLSLYEERSEEARRLLGELVVLLEKVDSHPPLGRASLHAARALEVLRVPRSFQELGVPEDGYMGSIDEMARSVLDMAITHVAPIDVSLDDVRIILERAYRGPTPLGKAEEAGGEKAR